MKFFKILSSLYLGFTSISYGSSEIQTLYQGSDIYVEAHLPKGKSNPSRNLWICFGSLKFLPKDSFQEGSLTHFQASTERWGQPFFKKHKIDTIHIENYANHWYQTGDMDLAIQAIKDFRKDKTYEHIITYGLSLGGSAAIRFSERLEATRVLALAPQVQFHDPRKRPDWRWDMVRRSQGLKEIYPLPQGYNTCDFFVLYGRYNEADHSIVTDPKGLSTVVTDDDKLHIFPLDTDKHPLGIYLTDQSLLGKVVEAADHRGAEDLAEALQPVLWQEGSSLLYPSQSGFLGEIMGHVNTAIADPLHMDKHLETILGCIGREAAFKVCKTLSILSLYRCDLAQKMPQEMAYELFGGIPRKLKTRTRID